MATRRDCQPWKFPAKKLAFLAQVVPLHASGWNLDVIQEAQSPSAAFAFSDFGPGIAIATGSSWFEEGFLNNTNGLPHSRRIVSALHTNIVFEFQPYTASNVLKLNQRFPTGTLTFAEPKPLSFLSILATSTLNGGGFGKLVLNFADGTSSGPINYLAENWGEAGPRLAYGGLSAYSKGSGNDSIYKDPGTPGFGFHQTDIDLAARGWDRKPIQSITFTKPGNQSNPFITGIFALSGIVAVPRAELRSPRKTAAGEFEFEIGFAPLTYTVESSSDLVNWAEPADLMFPDPATVRDPLNQNLPRRFYRITYFAQ